MPPHALHCLIDRPPWRIDLAPGDWGRLVVSFASVGHDPGRVPSPEFVGSATAAGRAALFVSDESRSWANAPGLEAALADAVARLPQPPAQIVTIGQSMGAFCALAAAEVLPVSAVLAFGPQFSVDPARMPQETRWDTWTRRLGPLRHATAPLPADPWLVLFHGLQDDRDQALAFPQRAGLDHVLFPALGHSGLVAHLKARGLLPGLIESAFEADRRRLLRIAASAGGRLRQRLAGQLPR